MEEVTGAGSLPEGVHITTGQLRRAAAAGARLRLPWQLDTRLDTALDPDGAHILGLFAVLDREPGTGEAFPEPVARCAAMPQFIGLPEGLAFHLALDLRVTDYAACRPLNFARMAPETVDAWRTFMAELREKPWVFDRHPRSPYTAGRTAVIARTGLPPGGHRWRG